MIAVTESPEPMKRKLQSGGTTEMKCSISGARMGLGRFSIKRASLDALYDELLWGILMTLEFAGDSDGESCKASMTTIVLQFC